MLHIFYGTPRANDALCVGAATLSAGREQAVLLVRFAADMPADTPLNLCGVTELRSPLLGQDTAALAPDSVEVIATGCVADEKFIGLADTVCELREEHHE